jgi:SAM-dependent methyltransferase
MELRDRESAEQVREQVALRRLPPTAFRAALLRVPPLDRDAWLDLVFEFDEIPDDGPELPRGCVPYVPCSVEVLLLMVHSAQLDAGDVFVDVGAGAGRAAAVVHLLTGAEVIGLEIQPALVEAARKLAARLNITCLAAIEGDATELIGRMHEGSVFFFYCPFSGERLDRVLAALEVLSRSRPIRLCCVDLPLPALPWLDLAAAPSPALTVYRSVTRPWRGTARSQR